jgi:hypothetical protein
MRLPAALAFGVVAFVPTPAPSYEVYAVRFAGLHGAPLAVLVKGADTSRRQDLAFMVWLMKGPNGRNVLLDAGFYREKVKKFFSPIDFEKPSTARRCRDCASGAGGRWFKSSRPDLLTRCLSFASPCLGLCGTRQGVFASTRPPAKFARVVRLDVDGELAVGRGVSRVGSMLSVAAAVES